ncbi:hypothetical protein MKZ38_009192 [Zalerion maritima]|uniref:SPT2 chromatin protein n=1 Tax=Zalerion maritima TaxID=339359 RepID=A0AAD5WN97_9PEZI|nr:hypothetical protein MKZ38_009192 [Zalerion maritima]
MPISDLLAQIQGTSATGAAPAKRKAADDLPRESPVRKLPRPNGGNPQPPPRTTTAPPPSSKPTQSNSASRPSLPSIGARAATASPRSADRPSEKTSNIVRKPMSGQSTARAQNSSTSNNRPSSVFSGTPAPADTVSRPPPKKGSFAEIMARASRAQNMKSAGSIQHKPIEKGPMKRREEARIEQSRKAKEDIRLGRRPGAGTHPGQTAEPVSRSGSALVSTSRNGARTGYKGTARVAPKTAPARKKTTVPPPELEKKVKKTTTASTGYQGTARPQPAAAPKSSKPASGKISTPSTRGGRRGEEPKNAFTAFARRPKPKYEDDEDSEMDDFIVDDEDDDGGRGPRYDYASDGSSDMEAGLDDVWHEEEKAARIARMEDLKEERELQRKAEEKARRLGRK